MFQIRLLPSTKVGLDGQRLGEIVAADLHETFSCYSKNVTALEAQWREQLQGLVEGETIALLRHDPRFAWVVYREDTHCYIQQILSLDGSFANMLPRITVSDDGDEVSEWVTDLDDVVQFLNADACSGSL